ncbi:MAG: TorF family putative porin [Draconibacterium sp.]|nr:TorF family putative porin [Draconibacterium sp.]
MKKTLLIAATFLMFLAITPQAKAQEVSTGLDIYSSYVWRGIKFGSGVAFQPYVEFSAGGFALGAWGSYCASTDEAAEADLYASYGFDLGENASLSLTVTDYYFPSPGTSWMEGENHFIEPMVSAGFGAVSLTAAYMLYDGAGTNGEGSGDLYLEAAVTAGPVDITLGGGNGAYSMKEDAGFDICNIGISSSKEIKITDDFSLPVSGAAILNPSYESFHIVVGISL